jgi:hypothetical protein
VPVSALAVVVQRTRGAKVRTGTAKTTPGSKFAAVRQTLLRSCFDQPDQLPLDQYNSIVITVDR